ncbi:MAG: hypothetical protein H7841_00860 [Magnetospirillum sp. WYHS-4]
MQPPATSFVLGYHGCDESVAKDLLDGGEFRASTNDYDRLGQGRYCWESNPLRGLEWARFLASGAISGRKVKNPTVVGAVINLGHCLDLTTSQGTQLVTEAHRSLVTMSEAAGNQLPGNKANPPLRRLDCAVMEHLHQIRTELSLAPFDSVRGLFPEGEPLYPEAGFLDRTHVQICVRNPECIIGLFKVRDEFLRP